MAPSQEEYFSVDMEFITADKQLTADSPDDTDLLDSIDFLLDDQAVVSADDEFDESLLSPEEPSSTASTSNDSDDGDDAMQVDATNLISLHKSIRRQQNMLLKNKRQNSLSDLSSYSNNTVSSSLPYNNNNNNKINDTMSPTEQYNQALQNLAESMRRTEVSRKQVMQFQHTSLSPEQQGMLALAKERLRQQNQMVVSSSMMAENCSLLKDVRGRLLSSSGFTRL